MKYLLITLLSFFLNIQSLKAQVVDDEPYFEMATGLFGGSYYDISSGTKLLDKYGPQRLSPTGGYVGMGLKNTFGEIKLDYFAITSKEIGGSIGTQLSISYKSPYVKLREGNRSLLFVDGDAKIYAHNQRYIKDDIISSGTQDNDDYIRLQTSFDKLGVNMGYKHNLFNKELSHFNFIMNGTVKIQPLGLIIFKSTLQQTHVDSDDVLENYDSPNGISYSGGGEIEAKAEVNYKGKIALMFKFNQDYYITFDHSDVTLNNRYLKADLEYRFKKLYLALGVSNQENIWIDSQRRAIDVFNTSTFRLKIPLN